MMILFDPLLVALVSMLIGFTVGAVLAGWWEGTHEEK